MLITESRKDHWCLPPNSKASIDLAICDKLCISSCYMREISMFYTKMEK